jgi:hypothetical protein
VNVVGGLGFQTHPEISLARGWSQSQPPLKPQRGTSKKKNQRAEKAHQTKSAMLRLFACQDTAWLCQAWQFSTVTPCKAFKIKDFGDTIPGHGGFMDRFDCQVIMATFVNVYISSFIRSPSPNKLFNQLLTFKYEEQIEFLRLVKNHFGDIANLH